MCSATAPTSEPLEHLLAGAVLVGAEMDVRYRVLGVTVEAAPDRDPRGDVEDRRLQLLCHPVSTLLGSLHRDVDGVRHLETFDVEQLADITSAFAGLPLEAPVLGRPEPRPGEWGPQFSMQGRSTAPDGRRRTVTVEVASADARLRLFVRCDEVEVRDAAGTEIPIG
jgi:hypothetical protein